MKYLLLFAGFLGDAPRSIDVFVNDIEWKGGKTVYVTTEDIVELSTAEEKLWIRYKPVYKEYDNLANGSAVEKIDYHMLPLSSGATSRIELDLSAGTHQIGFLAKSVDTQFSTNEPLHLTRQNTVQIVVRESNDYLGFLTELLGLPFVIPPMMVGVYGHQTDLHLGTDCAELAIYGMRRMGFDIPYGGPRGVLNYVEPTDKLMRGTLVHYGFQVSVVYEDRGVVGRLDNEDLLIHAYLDKVAIERLGDIELKDREYRLYRWKDHLPEG